MQSLVNDYYIWLIDWLIDVNKVIGIYRFILCQEVRLYVYINIFCFFRFTKTINFEDVVGLTEGFSYGCGD